MDKFTRKELKTDKFALEVGHTVEYVGEHKKQVVLYAGIAIAVLVIACVVYWYRGRQHDARQAALYQAMRVQDAAVGQSGTDFVVTFPTQEAKSKGVAEAMSSVVAKYSGSEEATIAQHYLGVNAADQGKLNEAEQAWKQNVESGSKPYSSLSQFSLAELYEAQGKRAEAEKLLRAIIDSPTILVSKEQATIALARLIAKSNPAEARKLLEPMRTERSAVSRAAISALSELSAPK